MNFPDYFADAESNFDEAKFVIFGIPYDKTTSFRAGAKQAPKEIRLASWNFETYNFRTGFDLRDVKLHDYGDIDVRDKIPKDMIKDVRNFISKLISKNKFPIALGGEHSITPGIIQGFSNDIAVLALDAHLDFRQEYENEIYNHACCSRRIADYVGIKNIAVLGIRSAEKEEFEDAKKLGLFYIDALEIVKNGIKKVLDKTKEYIGDKQIYLSLDIDVLDPAYAPGTSTPEPFGLKPLDIIRCIETFSLNLIGFDVVEVCPPYDKGQAALLAAKYIRYIIEQVELRN